LNRSENGQRIGRTATDIDDRNPEYAGQLGWGRVDMLESVTSP
jgi:hypothetical protein